MLYQIARITRPGGRPATDADSIRRIGRECSILQLEQGYPLMLAYAEPDTGVLLTSPVTKIRSREARTIQVTTRRRSYYLREVEAGDDETPMFDLER